MAAQRGIFPDGDRRWAVTPTPELQELYDKYREAEDGLDLSDRLVLQAGQASDDTNAPLRLETLSQGTMMSRSPSCASHHSANLSGPDANDNRETSHLDARPKGRAKRHGPLSETKRLRAAFIRKLGACLQCRSRKVSVRVHFSLNTLLIAHMDGSANTTIYRPLSSLMAQENRGSRQHSRFDPAARSQQPILPPCHSVLRHRKALSFRG